MHVQLSVVHAHNGTQLHTHIAVHTHALFCMYNGMHRALRTHSYTQCKCMYTATPTQLLTACLRPGTSAYTAAHRNTHTPAHAVTCNSVRAHTKLYTSAQHAHAHAVHPDSMHMQLNAHTAMCAQNCVHPCTPHPLYMQNTCTLAQATG